MRTNRWSIAVAGVLLQIALGAVYAWRRRTAFVVMFLLQVLLFWILHEVASVAALTFVSFVVLMRYGGGFGTMPAFTADYFGSKNIGPIYGLMLTAWGFASAFGPLLIAHMRQASGSYRSALHVIAVAAAGLPHMRDEKRTKCAGQARSEQHTSELQARSDFVC